MHTAPSAVQEYLGPKFSYNDRRSPRRLRGTVPARFAWLAIGVLTILGFVSFSAVAGPSGFAAATPTPVFNAETGEASPLNLSASLANWTWVGPGSPCSGGTGGLVANFVAHASGGAPPYRYLWNFGDGSPPSNQQNPSHHYSFSVPEYNVTVTSTDSSGATAPASFTVFGPFYNCPAKLVSPLETTASGLPVVAIAGGVVVGTVLVVVVVIRRPRGPHAPR